MTLWKHCLRDKKNNLQVQKHSKEQNSLHNVQPKLMQQEKKMFSTQLGKQGSLQGLIKEVKKKKGKGLRGKAKKKKKKS